RHRNHFHDLHAGENQAAPLHATSVSLARAFARPQAGSATLDTLFQELRDCIGFGLSCNCHRRSPPRRPVFSCLPTLPRITGAFATGHAIWRGRVPGTEYCLVLSEPGERFSCADEQSPCCGFYDGSRSTLCDSSDFTSHDAFPEPSSDMEN